ncbi:MAG: ABC transporter permease subunit, partial [Peptococcaceae bacterium]|jgi:osmoprotectant transport system permease protein|nr:ABC transporter permease subunit [Peptococcaceae bacterium]
MGLSSLEILNRIQLPLAAPVLMSGLRLATIASIGIATIAATVHSGGLGELLFEGIRTMNMVKIVWGILLSSALSFAANQIFVRLETWFSQKARGEAHRKTDMEIGKFDASL